MNERKMGKSAFDIKKEKVDGDREIGSEKRINLCGYVRQKERGN